MGETERGEWFDVKYDMVLVLMVLFFKRIPAPDAKVCSIILMNFLNGYKRITHSFQCRWKL
jgi:hypothetical protein